MMLLRVMGIGFPTNVVLYEMAKKFSLYQKAFAWYPHVISYIYMFFYTKAQVCGVSGLWMSYEQLLTFELQISPASSQLSLASWVLL